MGFDEWLQGRQMQVELNQQLNQLEQTKLLREMNSGTPSSRANIEAAVELDKAARAFSHDHELAATNFEKAARLGLFSSLVSFQWNRLIFGRNKQHYEAAVNLFNECFAQCRKCPPGIRPDTWQKEAPALSNHGLALLASNVGEPSLAESYFVQAKTAESKIFATLLFVHQGDTLNAQSMFGFISPQEADGLKKSLQIDATNCAQGSWTQSWLQDCSKLIESGLNIDLLSSLPQPEPLAPKIENIDSIENRLVKLTNLLQQGLISQEEFTSRKSKILDEI